ncbi:hypothetical protein Taro_015821 [Colocasia esculenta]|uniref:Uncharacterized protein n=1 Tax=Colocasia esculenta TaxID=4460 RepID=A0A843UR24_COLES|nr:hypothetical protein [Colocasia esculenta]
MSSSINPEKKGKTRTVPDIAAARYAAITGGLRSAASSKKLKKYKKKAMAAAWDNNNDSDSESSSSEEEEEKANLAFMANIDNKQEEVAAEVREEVLVPSPRRIEDIFPEHIEPVGRLSEVGTPITSVASVLRDVLESITCTQKEQAVTAEDVAPGHNENVQMEDAPAQGEQLLEKDAGSQGELTAGPQIPKIDDQFKEGVVESTSDEEEINVDHVEPISRASEKDKGVVPEIPLLTRKPHWRLT